MPRIELLVVRAEDRLDGLRTNRFNTFGHGGSDALRCYDSGTARQTFEMQEEWLSMRSKHHLAIRCKALRKHLKTAAPGLPQEITNLILRYGIGEAGLTAYEEKYPEVFLDAMDILVEAGRVATRHFACGGRSGTTIFFSRDPAQELHPDFAAAMDADILVIHS